MHVTDRVLPVSTCEKEEENLHTHGSAHRHVRGSPSRRPPGGVLTNYWRCLPRDSHHSRHVKTIVNTAHAISPVE